jgi:hypothetical protein
MLFGKRVFSFRSREIGPARDLHVFTCGDQSGRTSVPIIPHRVQTMRRHSDRTGTSSGSQRHCKRRRGMKRKSRWICEHGMRCFIGGQ